MKTPRTPQSHRKGLTMAEATMAAIATRAVEEAQAKWNAKAAAAAQWRRPDSRKGKRAVTVWVEPELAAALRITVARLDTTVQALVTEALTEYLKRNRAI